VIARKSGYITLEKQINFTNGFLYRNEKCLVTIPMMRYESPESSKAYAILTYNGNLKDIKLKASSTDSEEI
jgi:hypothetical protein